MIYQAIPGIDIPSEYPTFDVLVAVERLLLDYTSARLDRAELEDLIDQAADHIFGHTW